MTGHLSRLSCRCENGRRATVSVGGISFRKWYIPAVAPANKCTCPRVQARRARVRFLRRETNQSLSLSLSLSRPLSPPPPSPRVQRRQKVAGERDICGNFGINGRRLLFLRGERSAGEDPASLPLLPPAVPHVIPRIVRGSGGYLRICLYIDARAYI